MASVAGAGGEGQRSGVWLGRIERVGLNLRLISPDEAFYPEQRRTVAGERGLEE